MTRSAPPGLPAPLGASWDGEGTNLAVHAPTATGVSAVLVDGAGTESVVALGERSGAVWHGWLPGVGPGQLYGLRAEGPYEPSRGLRHDPAKLLTDPYARELRGTLTLDDALTSRGGRSAPFVPRSVVVDPSFPWGADRPPATPWPETVLYELHVKGFTQLHPDVPPALRGTYAGLAHPAVVDYLSGLGVTTLELLPVQHHVPELGLLRRGLTNYWGYSTLGFFAPHSGYAADPHPGGAVREFQAMVRTLHAAGLEVILDVVYNHTAEGDARGPTLCFRGLDNAGYYRLDERDPARYTDLTGCGNTWHAGSPVALTLVLDSLRYWVEQMHVDGFRFDLAPTLGRQAGPPGKQGEPAFDPASAFLTMVRADPVLSRVKLVAEPWDLGPGGYQVGAFPPPWAEWNGRFRDTVRDVWRGETTAVAELASRLAGSSDVYEAGGRTPQASVNFVTSHDGFPLADLVSYTCKHNEANGEGNRDGEGHNRSFSGGVEGPTTDPTLLTVRRRLRRAHLATLLLAAGVPMLLAGDERGRTQGGNNNSYCQDSPVSWVDWEPPPDRDPAGEDPLLAGLVRGLLDLRRRSPTLRQAAFFRGRPVVEGGLDDLAWFTPDGRQMSVEDWTAPTVGTLVAYLNGQALRTRDRYGRRQTDQSWLLVLNTRDTDAVVVLPGSPWAGGYEEVLDTGAESPDGLLAPPGTAARASHGRRTVQARSVAVLRVLPASG